MPNSSRPPSAATLTTTVGAMVLSVPLMTFTLYFVLVTDDGFGDFPATWALAILALAVGAYAFCEYVGFRTAPLEHGGEPHEVEAASWMRFTTSTFVRFAVCEAVFLISVPLGIITQSFWIVLVGAALGLALLTWEVWPGPRNQRRFAAALEARGVPSYLPGRPQDHL
ncbi:hypothetical protein [Kribbella caucasensis]|nr:hypothetical protein [Kribbella sp. VKM Ac-2527]